MHSASWMLSVAFFLLDIGVLISMMFISFTFSMSDLLSADDTRPLLSYGLALGDLSDFVSDRALLGLTLLGCFSLFPNPL